MLLDICSTRTESIGSPGLSELSLTIRSPSERKVNIRHDSTISEPVQSDPEHVRLHTREHLTQRFTLEDGSEVQVSIVILEPSRQY